jgi:UDP-N-acetylglucosamine--N-acetylmuramyl-(pentapeptide) pyrophosphoryl-undecaprenol N-acetylglucosamine transferase
MEKIKEIKIKIILTGGGTGGHVYPLVSVFRSLKQMASQKLLTIDALYMGADGFAKEELEKEGIKVKVISSGKMRRYFSILNFFDIFKLIFGFFQSLWLVWKFMPDVIFSKGGYGSVPVVIVGWLYRIPVFIHESDSVPGLSNRIATKFAARIGASFPKALEYFPAEKTALVGNPIRTDLLYQANKEEGLKHFGFSSEKNTILILGGSQGSQRINDLILEILYECIKNNIQILHQTGEKNFKEVIAEARIILGNLPQEYLNLYQARGFFDEKEYALALAAGDLVIARAGSGTIFELSAAKKPSILIPLPEAASDHQRENAFSFQKSGASVIFEEKNILPNMFLKEVVDLLKDREKLNDLGNRANLFSQQNPAENIAKEIFKLLKVQI